MKTQQQTLSVRISDAMRRRLESARHLLAKKTGEPLSISEVANRFLETAQDDSFEASELFSRPTETLLNIRRKLEQRRSLSRAEWQVFGYYLQQGCESPLEGSLTNSESYVVMLEAFLAALALLKPGKDHELDYEYLWNLVADPLRPEIEVTRDEIIKAARQNLRRLKDSSPATNKWVPTFIGRSLRFLFGDERLRRIEVLNETLRPYLTVLFRIAARGHYLREGRPVREQRADHRMPRPGPPPVVVGDSKLSISLTDDNDFSMVLDLEPQRVLYPLEPYPVICDFAAMLKALKPGERAWRGREFFAYTGEGRTAFNFYRRSNGIIVAFSAEEWNALGELMNRALALPEMQLVLEDAALAYGEF